MDTPSSTEGQQSSGASVASRLAQLDLLFDLKVHTFNLSASKIQIATKNVYRAYLRFEYVSGFAAQIIVGPNDPTATYLLLNQTNPVREFFIEKDKQLTTWEWWAIAPGGATVLTSIETQYRGN